jgi:hypothetical protein
VPRGKKFASDKLNETIEALDKVTPKPKNTINLRQLIRGLKPKIKRLRSWGYEWHEVVQLLQQQGIEIAEDTLKEYLKTPRRKKEKPILSETSIQQSDSLTKNKQNKNSKLGIDSKSKLETKPETIEDKKSPKLESEDNKPRRKLKENNKDESSYFNL